MKIIYPFWLYKTTWIYHITSIDNLESILRAGCLICANDLSNQTRFSIANEDVQNKRKMKRVALPPYGTLHDYVPFYFAPNSPMLYVNYKGGMLNSSPQNRIVYLVSFAQQVENSNLKFLFYDRHALAQYANSYDKLKDLDKIDWDLFFEEPLEGEYAKHWKSRNSDQNPKWSNRKEIRQAEFLVYKKFPWNFFTKVATINQESCAKVEAMFAKFKINTPVIAKPEWYFHDNKSNAR